MKIYGQKIIPKLAQAIQDKGNRDRTKFANGTFQLIQSPIIESHFQQRRINKIKENSPALPSISDYQRNIVNELKDNSIYIGALDETIQNLDLSSFTLNEQKKIIHELQNLKINQEMLSKLESKLLQMAHRAPAGTDCIRPGADFILNEFPELYAFAALKDNIYMAENYIGSPIGIDGVVARCAMYPGKQNSKRNSFFNIHTDVEGREREVLKGGLYAGNTGTNNAPLVVAKEVPPLSHPYRYGAAKKEFKEILGKQGSLTWFDPCRIPHYQKTAAPGHFRPSVQITFISRETSCPFYARSPWEKKQLNKIFNYIVDKVPNELLPSELEKIIFWGDHLKPAAKFFYMLRKPAAQTQDYLQV